MIGRKFTDLKNGRIVEVKDAFEDIIILDNKNKVRLDRLMDKEHFEEYIDPNNFFKNESLLNSFAQKIRQIPDNVIKNIKDKTPVNENVSNKNFKKAATNFGDISPATEELAILPADPELEKAELMRKYGILENPIIEAQRQLDKFKSILEDTEEEIEQVINELGETTSVQTYTINRDEEQEEDQDDDYEEVKEVVKVQHKKTIKAEVNKVEDPIITMFKNVKRNKDFKINFDFTDKIPRTDFIEMMEDSYNTSIIEFLADEFLEKILSNPEFLREKIVSEIKDMVYGSNKTVSEITEVKVQPQKKSGRGRKKLEETND